MTLTLEGRDYEPALVWRRLFATAKRPDFGLSARAAQHAGEQWLAWSSNLADLHGSVVVNPAQCSWTRRTVSRSSRWPTPSGW